MAPAGSDPVASCSARREAARSERGAVAVWAGEALEAGGEVAGARRGGVPIQVDADARREHEPVAGVELPRIVPGGDEVGGGEPGGAEVLPEPASSPGMGGGEARLGRRVGSTGGEERRERLGEDLGHGRPDDAGGELGVLERLDPGPAPVPMEACRGGEDREAALLVLHRSLHPPPPDAEELLVGMEPIDGREPVEILRARHGRGVLGFAQQGGGMDPAEVDDVRALQPAGSPGPLAGDDPGEVPHHPGGVGHDGARPTNTRSIASPSSSSRRTCRIALPRRSTSRSGKSSRIVSSS